MRRSTIVYVLLLAVTAGAYFYLKNREAPVEAPEIAFTFEPAEEISFLFSSEYGEPVGIRMEAKTGEVVELARNEENVWAMILPIKAAAEQFAAEAAISQVVTIRIMDRLQSVAPKDVGLDDPQYTLTVEFEDGVKRIVYIGVVTPSETGYYALVDDQVVIVSKAALDALIGLIASPPYAETPTPSPSPVTETDVPPPSTTGTLPSATEAVTPTIESATPTPTP